MEGESDKKSAVSQINVVIGTLLESAADKNDSVCYSVNNALKKIAKKHPNELLKTACLYRQRNPKLTNEHVAALLQPMEDICQEQIIEIDGDTVLLLINYCVEEMTKSMEYIPNVQMTASAVLVAIGKKHCIQVMEGILKKFIVGTVPHYTIPHTMGALASSNPFAVLPFLKSILGTMLPMLGMLRSDPLKQSFAFSLGRFCEAINEYMSNIKSAPDPTIQKDMFSTEIGIAYDVLSSSWLQSREQKLVETVLQALGSMFSILTPEKVTDQTPKMITTLLFMCKKQKDCYSITQCLAAVLLVVVNHNQSLLEPQIDALLNTLSEIITPVPDYVRTETVKNQAEALRCYDQIGRYFCDKTVDHLILMLKNNNERERMKALIVVTHLVNSSDSVIKTRAPDLITILKQMLTEQNVRVKIVLLKAIVAFAYHGHFFNPECNIFIEFIIKLCCSSNAVNSKGVQDMNDTDWTEMLRTCDNSLFLLTSSVLELENVFWNLFHECILNKDYTNACCTLLKCLTNLAARKNEHSKMSDEENTQISSLSVFVRCLSLLASPFTANRGTFILSFFKNYSYYVHKHLRALWEVQIPQLLNYLELETWNIEDWQGKVLQFLSLTIKEIDETKWTENLATTFIEQLPLYYLSSDEKGFSLRCLATVMCHVEDSQFVKKNFEVLLTTARFNSSEDAMECAKAVGICARVHMHPAILKLNIIRREELLKKANKFLNFNFIKDVKHENEVEKLRYTIIACYSELVLEAPAEKLLLTIEHEVLDWVVKELQTTKDFLIKNICIYTIGKIADAMHPARNTLHIRMQTRDEVLTLILGQLQLHNGPEYIELCPVILPVLTSLVKLRNELEAEQRVTLIKTSFDTIYNAAAIYCKLNTTKKDVSYGDLKLAPYVFNSFEKLNILTRTLLMQSMNPATLDDILTMLEPWLNKKKPEQRLPAIENLKSILDCYLTNMKFAYETPSKFGQTGFILGRIVPRCTDPNTSIRLVALECVRLILCIAARYEGHMSDYNNEIGNKLFSLKTDIVSSNPKVLYSVTSDIAKIIAEYLPQFQQMHFTESLLDGLLDHEPSSSSGGCVTLNVFLKLKGGELYQHVNDIIVKLLNYMNLMTCNKTRTSSVRSVMAMAVHHSKSVVSILLTNPLPYDSCVSDCWVALAQDATLAADILEQFKRIFNTIPLYEEQQNAEKLRICTLQPLAAVCALREMFRNSQMQELVSSQFPELFVILSMVFTSYIGTSPPIHAPQSQSQQLHKKDKYFVPNRDAYKLVPARIALEALKLLLLCAKQDRVVEVFLQGATLESCSSLMPVIDIMPSLAESIFSHAASTVARMVAAMNTYAKSGFEPQRITVNAFFVEVMKHGGGGQPALVETVMSTLLDAQTDMAPLVRLLALRGLGHAARLDADQCSRHATFVVAALMQGIDDCEVSSEANIPLEAMLSFSAMLLGADERSLDVAALQVSAAVRIKPFFARGDAALRCASLRLFGDLARSLGKGSRADAFREQVDGNFVTLLLHLSDEDAAVVKACKYTLRQIAPLMDAKNVNIMIQDHLIDEGNLHYTNFISDLIKIMTEEVRDRFPFFVLNALSFLKSPWAEIRGNAALLVGLLFAQLPTAEASAPDTVQLDTVCYRLMQLLQDERPDVRAKAAQGLSCLFVTP